MMRTSESDIEKSIKELILRDLLDVDNGVTAPHDWNELQYKSDVTDPTNTDRQKRFRDKQRNAKVTQNTVTDTVTDKLPDTDTDTDTETETDTEQKDSLAKARVKNQFEVFWSIYPRRLAKGAADKAWKSAIKKNMPDEIIAAAQLFAAQQVGKDPQYIAHPATWLNQERWKDEPQIITQNQFSGQKNGSSKPNSIAAGFAIVDQHIAALERAEREGSQGEYIEDVSGVS